MESEGRQFWSEDRRFGLRLAQDVLDDIRRLCTATNGRETGGILIGRYSEDLRCAEVTEASGPPSDSTCARSWLVRGVRGLVDRLRSCWRLRHEYYVGEWHYHPSGSLAESSTDSSTMARVSQSKHVDCPEPVGLIVAVRDDGSLRMSASVFTGCRGQIVLKQVGATDKLRPTP